MDNNQTRRNFLQKSIAAGIGLSLLDPATAAAFAKKPKINLGLVTYQWGKDWDLPTLLKNCEASGLLGVELRTEHAHGVESSLSANERKEVKKRFKDSPVTCLGYGSNYAYHYTDQAEVRQNIEGTKEYLKLCKDIGATGIKVKPNGLPAEVSKEQTIAQIAKSFNEVGKYASDLGQLVRVEVHGKLTQQLPNMKAIFDQVTEKSVKVCWNSNDQDLMAPGLEANFNSVKKWLGDTVHIRELNEGKYPYQELMNLFVEMNYKGWILLEARTTPADRVAAMREQLDIFNTMLANAK
ncbi:sugar phosphate isomerase/epimerase family protein [Cyclobacterium qasimii]|uniref:Xylose isomerase-like TIM barrel domain-containing protein n=2 Tax=Cyclobacterium qasimii TaxID=1350429 RepID=S7VGJ6_9BACT|nr:TIM barrel protein [Cyclobacterium qasimii]EPR69335.1 hypothetical protein ADICYQ_1682 [Cyclobacterium qasimii M12-11B]GEO20727.1 hypothetical protein CQA01_12610 [Cyclobacterium qasimii]